MRFIATIFLSFFLFGTAFAACEDRPGTTPYVGKITQLTVGSSSRNNNGLGSVIIKVTGPQGVQEYRLCRADSAGEDNSAFMAFYDVAQIAYLNDLEVTINAYPIPPLGVGYTGYSIQLNK